jgi:hypothetical protein
MVVKDTATMRDKIEQIIATVTPKLRFQLTVLERVEDWVAYTSNLIQTLGLKVSAGWRITWGDKLYYIIEGARETKIGIMTRFGLHRIPETKFVIVSMIESKDEKRLAEYYIQNVIRHWIRDKAFDEFLKEIMRWLS